MESLGCCLTLRPGLVTVVGVCVVKAGEVGRSGTAGTGWRRDREPATPHLPPPTWHGTAATGSGRTFWTGATREEDRGVSWNEPRCTSTSSCWCSLKLWTSGSLVSLARGSLPSV